MIRRVLFAGGGTGGHVFMAVAVRDCMAARAGARLQSLFVGTPAGLENRILPPLGFPLETIQIGGLQRVGLRRQLATLVRLAPSLLRSLQIVKRFAPQVVVGLGGYSSGPVVAAARLRRVPAVLIEPNVIPGLTNRWLARFCDGAAVAFEATAAHFRGRVRLTGIPIRQEFHGIRSRPGSRPGLGVLIFGGSRGSRPINRLVSEALPALAGLPLEIVHQTGPEDRERVERAYAEAGVSAHVVEFLHDMPARFERADLIVSRSGASTIAEITAAGRPSLLIPFPHAADDHQTVNARALVERGAALLLEERTAAPRDLADAVASLEADRPRLAAMGEAARSLARPDSSERIAELLEEVAGGGS